MTALPSLPIREVLRGRRFSWVDLVVGAGIIVLLHVVVTTTGAPTRPDTPPGRPE